MSLLFNKSLSLCILLLLRLPAQVLAARPTDSSPNFDADDAALRTEQAWGAYNLPYGTLGMVSHVFMLWYLACHLFGRSPVMPWTELKHHVWNMVDTFVTSVVSISLVAVNLSGDVRESRALTAMAVLQILYSVVVDGVAVHRYFQARRKEDEKLMMPDGEPVKGRRGMRWHLAPWLLVLLVASFVNSQIMGTLSEIGHNPRLDGVTSFNSKTEGTDPTGVALVICAMVGGVLAVIALLLGGCGSVICSGARKGNDSGKRYSRGSTIAVSIFAFFGLVSCLGFLLVADYAVGVVTGNAKGNPGHGKRSSAKFWVFFVFQYVPMFTF